MSVRLQIIIVSIAIVLLFFVVGLVKKKKIDFKYALSWIALLIVILILTLIPGLLNWISKMLGIASPVNMLFFFGFCLSLCVIFGLSMTISHLGDKTRKLAQEVAILKKSIYEDDIKREHSE